jgi:hypothetical protein
VGVCEWRAQQCVPREDTQGFEGMLPFTGQTRSAEHPGLLRRGQYGATVRGQQWRSDTPVPLTLTAQDAAFEAPLVAPSVADVHALLAAEDRSVLAGALRRALAAPDLNALWTAVRADPSVRSSFPAGVGEPQMRFLRAALQALAARDLAAARDAGGESVDAILAHLPPALRDYAQRWRERQRQSAQLPWWRRLSAQARQQLRAAARAHQDAPDLVPAVESSGEAPAARDASGALTPAARDYLAHF